jgi:hypothetical protein
VRALAGLASCLEAELSRLPGGMRGRSPDLKEPARSGGLKPAILFTPIRGPTAQPESVASLEHFFDGRLYLLPSNPPKFALVF